MQSVVGQKTEACVKCTAVHLQALVRLVVFAILLATAGAVTKLMAMNLESTRSIIWRDHDMEDRIGLSLRVSAQCSSDMNLTQHTCCNQQLRVRQQQTATILEST
jgi:hypothetical protein